MPEGLTVEVAHKMSEHRPHESAREQFLEIVEALMLSVVAVVTAWCGYQAAKWDGRQAYLYGTSGRLGVQAAAKATEGGQQRLLDVVTLNTWIRLREEKNAQVAALYERRFSPEYKVAFDAWLKTDPLNNPSAPPGPSHMPEYHNSLLEQSARLNRQSADAFAEGAHAREIAEVYVQRSVMLATVLFLTALAQRFKIRRVRIALLLVAAVLLAYQLVDLGMHPRL
jgi:hypothetical protein